MNRLLLIARELAYRDQQIEALQAENAALKAQIEAAKSQEPFGFWHQAEDPDESEFFLFSDSGDVSCEQCIKLYAATLPPGLRDLSDEEINRVFGMCGVPQTQTLEWLVKECIKAAMEKQ